MSDLPVWRDPARPVDERAGALLAAMTLTEKLAQLGSFWPRPAEERELKDPNGDVAPLAHAFQPAADTFEEAAVHGLGHVTRAFGSVPVAPADGMEQVVALQKVLTDGTRLGVPAIVHEECLTGFTTLGATVFPASIAWGATFDPDLVHDMALAIGRGMHAVGVHQGLSPVLDVVRDYRWGRVEETIGEDPYLVATVGSAYVRGLEDAGVVATLKHFAGYSASRAGRNHAPVPMGRRELEDVLLVPFEMAVREGGARSVMNSYADVDGVPAGASRFLLTEVLRERWGFTGTVVSDYWTVPFLDMMHRLAPDRAGAAAAALAAGLDVELPDTDGFGRLEPLVADGRLPLELVDRAVTRVLRQKIDLGLLDPGFRPVPALGETVDLDPPENRRLAERVAEESIVLVATDGVLPLAADTTARIALIGPSADEAGGFMGCYSFPNHIMVRYEGAGHGIEVPTLAEALRAELPTARFEVARGVDFTDPDVSGIAAAVAAAERADVVVLAVGDIAGLFGRGTSGEGCDVEDLTLPGAQAQLVEAVLATGTPTVLVLVTGRPYAVGAFADRCAAIVQAFMPGEEGGRALAGVLSGRVTPSGRLPVGLPARPGGQPSTYLAPVLGRGEYPVSNLDPTPAYPFGHGLSYTTFAYEALSVDRPAISSREAVEVAVTVRNTGDRAGVEVVQLYLSDEAAQVVRPVRWLVGYTRVPLAPGEAAVATFTVHAERASFTGVDLQRLVEAGGLVLAAGPSSEDLPLTARVEVTDTRTLHGAHVITTPVTVRAV